jgi:hypothetical protein
MQGAQAQARAYESIGNSIGGALKSIGSSVAGAMIQAQAANAPVPESQVKAAEARGVDFGPRERVSTGGSDSGIVQYKPITQQVFDRAVANQGQIATIQSGDLNNQRTLLAVKEMGLRLDTLRGEMSLRNYGMSAPTSLFPGQLYPVSPLGSIPSYAPQTGTYGLTPAGVYGAVPAYALPR